MTPDPLDLDAVEALCDAATPGPWQIWNGPEYEHGGRDLCIGAGKTWLANMDERACGVETMGRLVLRVCRECHAQRLAEDFERIMAQRNKRTEATP